MSVNQLPYEPIRFTGRDSDRRQQLVAGYRMGYDRVAVDPFQEAFAPHFPCAVQDAVALDASLQ